MDTWRALFVVCADSALCNTAGNTGVEQGKKQGKSCLGREYMDTIRGAKKKVRKLLCLAGLVILTFTACSSTELEEKSLPLFAAVEKQDINNTTIEIVYEPKTENKVLDYNHLKVMVLEEEFLQNEGQYVRLLEQLKAEETFPRNVYACVTDNAGKIIAAGDLITEDIGVYIEELLENKDTSNAKDFPTVGQLMDDLANRKKNLDLPYLTVDGDRVVWDGFYRIKKAVPLYKLPDSGNNME